MLTVFDNGGFKRLTCMWYIIVIHLQAVGLARYVNDVGGEVIANYTLPCNL